MGYTRHHAIVVTSQVDELIEEAHRRAVGTFDGDHVTPILPDACNGWRSFLVGPDGSKEGWDLSADGDRRRAWFVEWLESKRDGEDTPLKWAAVRYGDDELPAIVEAESEKNG